MKFERSSGILLHPTSLPGPYGIGDIGPKAYRWVDFLAKAGCSLWQVLPLGPTGYGDSPYQCFSSFAGNPYWISLEALLDDHLLHPDDFFDMPHFPADRVDYGVLIPWKLNVLNRAFDRFERSASPQLHAELSDFQFTQASWLEDYALFMALKEAHGYAPWTTWEPRYRDRQAGAMVEAKEKFSQSFRQQIFRQFLFFRQWQALLNYTHQQGISIIGDIPIFVAHDSADVWAHPDLFYLDKQGLPTVIAGVPPDYYSPTGQLWGNPLYRWDLHAAQGYSWWLDRIRAVLSTVDIVRIDHFRGFAGYWEVPGDAETAEKGRWVPGPGASFFSSIQESLGELPIIAEDLGLITPDVENLRDDFELPGMKVMLFSFFETPQNPFLPHHFPTNCVVYTGTHDNDTVRGWYERVEEEEKEFYRRYLDRDGSKVAWDLIRAAWASVAVFALAPMQDLLNLGNEARMNYPGNPSGNWSWRMPSDALSEDLLARLKEFNFLYSRKKIEQPEEESQEAGINQEKSGGQ